MRMTRDKVIKFDSDDDDSEEPGKKRHKIIYGESENKTRKISNFLEN